MNGSSPAGRTMSTIEPKPARRRRLLRGSATTTVTLVLLAMTASPALAVDPARSTGSRWIPAALDPARQTTVVVELSGSPVAVREAGAIARGGRLSALSQTAIRAELRTRQDALLPSLAAMGAQVLGQYQDAYDGIKVRVAGRDVARIEALPGVRQVVPVPVYHLANVTSDTYTGVPAAWAAAGGLTGRGVKIGIVDTGIDYYHADFGGSGDPADFSADDGTSIGTPAFPNSKVAGGFDFVGDDYDAAGVGPALIPHPDADPLDCDGHGTHTAAIAAGLRRPVGRLHVPRAVQRQDAGGPAVHGRTRHRTRSHAVRAAGLRLQRLHGHGRRRHRLGCQEPSRCDQPVAGLAVRRPAIGRCRGGRQRGEGRPGRGRGRRQRRPECLRQQRARGVVASHRGRGRRRDPELPGGDDRGRERSVRRSSRTSSRTSRSPAGSTSWPVQTQRSGWAVTPTNTLACWRATSWSRAAEPARGSIGRRWARRPARPR